MEHFLVWKAMFFNMNWRIFHFFIWLIGFSIHIFLTGHMHLHIRTHTRTHSVVLSYIRRHQDWRLKLCLCVHISEFLSPQSSCFLVHGGLRVKLIKFITHHLHVTSVAQIRKLNLSVLKSQFTHLFHLHVICPFPTDTLLYLSKFLFFLSLCLPPPPPQCEGHSNKELS